ncbi:MMPL family transporter [Embleya scabrispora]|uniref:MMPL family transporter n=1 Tax=Embleya scabrispora TaxID=159449 RepID=UPI00035C3F16|nr:MMPL family transporter [Embleya scabrispora]MYS81412.1 MMPL family transporter [Streptomyces sp. SID5474]
MTFIEEVPRSADRVGAFARLAGFAHRRKWLVLGLWLAVLISTWGVASAVGDDYHEDYSIPGAESQRATDLLAKHASAEAGDTLQIVLRDDGGLRGEPTRQRVEAMLAQVSGLPGVAQVRSLYEDPSAIAPNGRIGYATVVLSGTSEEMTTAQTRHIYDTARRAQHAGLHVELGGEAARTMTQGEGGGAEGVGIVAALVILVFLFGTLIAAGLPIITALFAVGSSMAVVVAASQVFTIASWVPFVMILVGLGVGIDYALLIFARFRSELVRGTEPERAGTIALDAAGRSVFFAGCTVIAALLGLVALGLGSLQGMALAVALTVLGTMVASLTLLPALLAVFGKRFARQFVARAVKRAERGKAPEGTVWRKVGTAAQRRPLVALLIAVLALGALSVPTLSLRLGFSDAGNEPADTTSRKAYDLLAGGFGAGFNGPLIVVVDGGKGGAREAGAAVTAALRETPGVSAVVGPTATGDAAIATVIVFPTSSPQDRDTSELVTELREHVLPSVAATTDARYLVGGATAAAEDYSAKVADRMPLFIVIVVGVAIVLLMMVFRSVLIPLKAAVLNLLSIGAALGAMSLVFQHGMLGAEAGPIEPWVPVVVFAVIFGLSMDYEIFLVSRIHEEWRRTRDHALAVREGLAHTGSVITAAGAIMIVVFSAFLLSPQRALQQLGLGMAVAIFVDAVIIRCLIVPAIMQLLGPRAWWLPAPLAKVLPRLELERNRSRDQ